MVRQSGPREQVVPGLDVRRLGIPLQAGRVEWGVHLEWGVHAEAHEPRARTRHVCQRPASAAMTDQWDLSRGGLRPRHPQRERRCVVGDRSGRTDWIWPPAPGLASQPPDECQLTRQRAQMVVLARLAHRIC